MKIESLLGLGPEYEASYLHHVSQGKDYLKDNKIVFVGLCRSVGDVIENNIAKIIHMVEAISLDYKIILFENDSNDDTVSKLQSLSTNNPNIIYISQTLHRTHYGTVKTKARTEALAEYRNLLKDYIANNYSDYDLSVVFDIDFIDFSSDGFYHSLGLMKNYSYMSAICGNSFEFKPVLNETKSLWNYDSWAYRGSWWNDLCNTSTSKFIGYNPMLWFGLWILPRGSDPIRTNSGFGGMCIYKTELYLVGEYNGNDCEHVTFHYSIYHNKNIHFQLYLNPSQIMLL